MLVPVNQQKHALYSCDSYISMTFYKMVDAGQDDREATSKYVEELCSCLAVWDASSVAYKDPNNKQKKLGGLAVKLGFIQTFLFLHCFLFLLFSSSVPLFYASETSLRQPCCRPLTVNFLKFVNASLPT